MSVNEYPYESNMLGEINMEGSLVKKPLHKWGNRSYKVTTAPAIEPVTAADVKLFGRIDGSTEDTLIESFITSIRHAVEDLLGRAFIEQTITMLMDWWPGTRVELPRPPLISVTSVATLDEDDAATAYAASNYYVITNKEPGVIVIRNGSTPPVNTDRYHGGYRVIYKAGYGDEAADVPSLIKDAIKAWVTSFYETRTFDPRNPPPEVKGMLMGSDYEIPKI